jgi:hypothetical protein
MDDSDGHYFCRGHEIEEDFVEDYYSGDPSECESLADEQRPPPCLLSTTERTQMHYALFLHIFFAIVSEHELILKHGFEA